MCLVIVNLSQSQSKPINLLNNIPVARRAKLVDIEVKSVNMPRDLTKTQLFPGDFTMPPKSGLVLSFRLSASQNTKKPVDLYHNLISAPSRGVRLAAKLLGLDLNLKSVDLAKQEQMQPSFLKMNPQHTVPTMDDNGFYLYESRAIITYLANKYGKNKNYLYPKDPERRAVIDQRLYFDMGTLFQRFLDYWMPYMFAGAPLDEAKLKKLEEAFGFFDDMLKGSVYAAGDRITVADAALAASVSTIEAVGVIDVDNYPNVSRWYRNVQNALPDYENTNQKGALAFNEFANAMISKWKNA
uniref:Glutathione S-transferase d1 n=1 Tax=Bemisia tabaci TaxID=7038 RepID=A0A223FQY3_BEMTA|nr:glutathione S-transferase d1 [Bemisia tabaci]